MKRKRLTRVAISAILIICAAAMLIGCSEIWFKDETSKSPDYHVIEKTDDDSVDSDAEPQPVYAVFTLELRQPSDEQETESWDAYPHSKTDGELIKSWEIPFYGNTIYESVVKYFEDKDDSFTFRAEQHKFYMFHDCTLSDGTNYNLETVYIAVDGKYAYCANFQSILGDDGIAGTEDDVKVVVLVYRGWLY